MRATLLLADHAEVAEGKLYINGGGWTVTPQPMPFAIAMYVEVPWDQTNTKHSMLLELLDVDGHPVTVPESDDPIRVEFARWRLVVRLGSSPERRSASRSP